jgi:hypothetical protein
MSDTKNTQENPLAWLGIRANTGSLSRPFEYVCSLEDRQLSGGLVPGAVDKRKKSADLGLGNNGSCTIEDKAPRYY